MKIAANGPGTFRTAKARRPGRRPKGASCSATASGSRRACRSTGYGSRGEIQRTLSDPPELDRLRPVADAAGRRRPAGRLQRAAGDAADHRRLCAPLLTRGKVSCQNGNRAILNARRWAFGVPYYKKDVAAYRVYLANHEVGHVLGYGHQSCPVQGKRGAGDAAADQGTAGLPSQPVAGTASALSVEPR